MAITYLLDVNVLLALLWWDHAEHLATVRWFRSGGVSWATTPVTQAGFVRVLSNRSVSRGFVSPEGAMDLLEKNLTAVPRHVFWPADIPFVAPVRSACQQIIGPKQTTDAYLVALALRHAGKLATLDRGILELVKDRPGEDAVELIELPPAPPGVQ